MSRRRDSKLKFAEGGGGLAATALGAISAGTCQPCQPPNVAYAEGVGKATANACDTVDTKAASPLRPAPLPLSHRIPLRSHASRRRAGTRAHGHQAQISIH